MKESELLAYLRGEFARLTGVLQDLAERMPALTDAQRSARKRERQKRSDTHRDTQSDTQFSEESDTQSDTHRDTQTPPPLPCPSPLSSTPPILSSFIPLPHPNTKALSSEKLDDCQVIFEEWRSVMGHPAAKFTPERRRRVKARLAEGYSVARLVAAIHGCKKSPHNQGQNETGTKYDDLELFCRSGTKVERFEAMAPGAAVVSLPRKTDGELLDEAYAEAEAKNGRV